MPGRPCKLTPEVQGRICDAIRAGNYYEAATAAAGVDYATFRRWLERGAKASGGPFREFCEAVQKAQADAEATVVAQWREQIPANWQAARDFLARRFPGRWGPKERHEITGADGGPIRFSLEDMVEADNDLESWQRERATPERNGTPHGAP